MNIKRITQVLVIALTLNTVAPMRAESFIKDFVRPFWASLSTKGKSVVGVFAGLFGLSLCALCYQLREGFRSVQAEKAAEKKAKLAGFSASLKEHAQLNLRKRVLSKWIAQLTKEQIDEVQTHIKYLPANAEKTCLLDRTSYAQECSRSEFEFINEECGRSLLARMESTKRA